jgi:kynureninase
VIGDLRAPDRLRLGPAPITSRFTDVWDAANIIRRVAAGEEATGPRGSHGEEIFADGQA